MGGGIERFDFIADFDCTRLEMREICPKWPSRRSGGAHSAAEDAEVGEAGGYRVWNAEVAHLDLADVLSLRTGDNSSAGAGRVVGRGGISGKRLRHPQLPQCASSFPF